MSEIESADQRWERRVLERLAFESLAEQRRRRRWGIFFKLLGFAFLALLIYGVGDWGDRESPASSVTGPYAATVRMEGVLESGGDFSAERIIPSLQAAFEDRNAKGLVLRINSPGGSPVQAGLINDEIARLKKTRKNFPVIAVVEDICASGGYYVASAADRIYVDKASIVGSIGVLMDGFGFTGAMDKLGVERRLLTAGDNKGFLDPFSPVSPAQQAYAKTMLEDIHQQFIAVVRAGRGQRLKETPEMFSGLMWTGARAVELGLADGFGSAESVAREQLKAEKLRDMTQRRSFAERFAERFGATLSNTVLSRLGQFGLH